MLIFAPDQRQSTIVLDYATAIFEDSPLLSQLIQTRTADSLILNNNINIEVRSANFRRLRGATFIGVLGDEIAFWMDSDFSANPDSEILNSVKPGLLTTSGPMFSISSPYARKGELWKRYDENFGPDGDPCVLVAKGSSIDFNNTLPQAVIDRALEKDPVAARSEYLAEFRSDVEEFVSLDAVRACINPNIFERPPQSNLTYHGFVDPSGGSADAMSLAVGHVDMARQVMCVDCIRCVDPPFSPEVCEEFSRVLKSYRISKIIGDKYGGVWCREQFGRFGILYEQSAAPKSDLYLTLLALLNSRRIALLDNKKLVNESSALRDIPLAQDATASTMRRTAMTMFAMRLPAWPLSTTNMALTIHTSVAGNQTLTMAIVAAVSLLVSRRVAPRWRRLCTVHSPV